MSVKRGQPIPSNSEPRFAREDGAILVLFSPKLEYVEAGNHGEQERAIGSVEVTHLVDIELQGAEPPTNEAISAFVRGNVLFIVYPYVRAALQRLPSEFGLPSVLLPYLRRTMHGTVVPHDPDRSGD